MAHEEYTRGNRRVILDASELSPGHFEIMLMTAASGREIAVKTCRDEQTAEEIFRTMLQEYPPQQRSGEKKTPPPLTGKYKQLSQDLKAAAAAALAAAIAEEDDGGTCNFDAPSLRLPRWRESLVIQAAEEAGCGCFTWDCYGRKRYVFCLRVPGQARRREAAAQAATNLLKSFGYEAFCYMQMD